jgi:hypothetical protein
MTQLVLIGAAAGLAVGLVGGAWLGAWFVAARTLASLRRLRLGL